MNMLTKKVIITIIWLLLSSVNAHISADGFYVADFNYPIESLEKGKTVWEKVGKNYKISEQTKIKTGDKTFSIIKLKETIRLYLRENTVIGFDKIDLENKKIIITLNKGSIYFEVLKKYSDNWDIIIEGIIGRIVVNSQLMLIKNLHNNLLISVMDGEATLIKNGKKIKIREGFGLELIPDTPIIAPFPIPDPPVPEYPDDNSLITEGIKLKWSKIDGAVLYRVEVAKDKDFINIVKFTEVKDNTTGTEGLKEGKYYWRVSCINRKNLEGAFFDFNRFILQKSKASLVIKKQEKKVFISKIEIEDDDESLPPENTTGSVILGSLIFISLIILIII